MCLSTAYQNEMEDNKILMKNVMIVESTNNRVVLTDLFEHKIEIEGIIEKANLTDGYVIVRTQV